MKKPVMLFSLVVWLIFANTAIAIQWINSRGVWTWAVNNRYYQYTDQYGWTRFSGDAQVRIYQSEAENFEPFELLESAEF